MTNTEMAESHCYETEAIRDAAYALSVESGLSYLSCLAIIEARWNK